MHLPPPILTTPFYHSAPKRSLSYNDLKRKRLLRSSKSKSKLQPQHSQKLIIKTQKKKPIDSFAISLSAPKTAQDIQKIENSITQLKDVFDQIKHKTNPKKYIISKPFHTDRTRQQPENLRKISLIEKSSLPVSQKPSLFYESVEMAGNEKELIKQIISKKKSQRRLLKFDEIRAEVKRSKSNSKLNVLEEETASHSKIINQSPSQEAKEISQSKRNMRAKKFEIVEETPFIKYSKSKVAEKEVLENNYMTSNLNNNQSKQVSQLGEKSQYRSRRKLKIQDFRTERRDIELTKEGQRSEAKLKFHRRLKKTNSEIIIKTSEVSYNKSKYTSRVENKSTFQIKQLTNKSEILGKEIKKHQNFKKRNENFLEKEEEDQMNILKDLELSAINISEIQIKKEQSFTEIQNDISLVNAIEAQELQLQMKKSQPKIPETSPEEINSNFKESKQFFKKSKKQSGQKESSKKDDNLQNRENRENMSNLLEFVSLPTEELKVKISKSAKIGKKKNEMEKFKKIFPANFFNK